MSAVTSWKHSKSEARRGESPLGDEALPAPGSPPATLSPAVSGCTGLIFVLFFMLFWNGIVSVFVVQLVKNFAWPLGLFLIPFVLIGLVMIGVVIHRFLALFNPKPILTLGGPTLTLGTAGRLAWRVEGRPQRLRDLAIELSGTESSTYRRGTDTYTDHETFFVAELLRMEPTDDRFVTRSFTGEVDLLVPADTMHTLSAPSNSITWTIEVRGSIRWWPDVKATYPILVVPPEVPA